MREEDRTKFVRLASSRVSAALKAMQLVGNLSNRSNYDYTDEDVTKIFKALQDSLADTRRRFELAKKGNGSSRFSLD
jgi:hypothetical protein